MRMDVRHQAKPASLTRSRHRVGGFTLIEMMIVITLIIIIAAVSIPNLLRSRMIANESTAIGGMRTISSAEQQYQSAAITPFPSGMGQYGSLAQLGATLPPFVDNLLAAGVREGYTYLVVPGGVDGAPAYTANADPLIVNGTGARGFYIDQRGVITFAVGVPAGPNDNPVQ